MLKNLITNIYTHRRSRLILSLLSGLLLVISWYPPFTLLVLVAMLPLLALEHQIYEQEGAKSGRIFWRYAMLSLIIWNVGTVWWLWHASKAAAVFAWLANAFLMSIPLVLFHRVKKATNNRFGYLPLFVFWLAFEYIHLGWELSWPWLTLGNAFAFLHQAVQWYEFTGALGGSLWIWLVNILCFQSLLGRYKFYLPLLTALLPISLSLLMYFLYQEKGKPVEVVVVQPNLDCYKEKFDKSPGDGSLNLNTFVPYREQVRRYIQLSQRMLTDSTQLLAFPETSLHEVFMESDPMQDEAVREVNELVQRYPHVALLTGADTYVLYEDKASATPTAYHSSSGMIYDVFNTAVFLAHKKPIEFYHKSKRVLGVESNPLRGLSEGIGKLLTIDLGGFAGEVGYQAEREVFTSNKGVKVAPVICYESVYGEFVSDYIQKGGELICIITNDGWWQETPGHVQHLAYARLRAIEMRRSIARAANTGISGFINQRGDILQQSRYNEMTALRGKINTNNELTLYARTGDIPGKAAMYSSPLFLLLLFWRRFAGKKGK